MEGNNQMEFSDEQTTGHHQSTGWMSEKQAPKAVYTIIEQENRDDFWMRLGTAFVNRDNSLTVVLNALPTNNRLHIREQPRSRQERVS